MSRSMPLWRLSTDGNFKLERLLECNRAVLLLSLVELRTVLLYDLLTDDRTLPRLSRPSPVVLAVAVHALVPVDVMVDEYKVLYSQRYGMFSRYQSITTVRKKSRGTCMSVGGSTGVWCM